MYQGGDLIAILTGSPISLTSTGSYSLSGYINPYWPYPQSGSLYYSLGTGNLSTDGTNVFLVLPNAQTFNYPGGIGTYEVDMIANGYIFPLFVGPVNIYPSMRYNWTWGNI